MAPYTHMGECTSSLQRHTQEGITLTIPSYFCSHILFNCDVSWNDYRHPALPSLNDTHISFLPLLSNQGTSSAGSPETHGQDLSRQSVFCPEAIKDDIVGALLLFILCNEAPSLKSYILISINIRSCSLVSAVVHIR